MPDYGPLDALLGLAGTAGHPDAVLLARIERYTFLRDSHSRRVAGKGNAAPASTGETWREMDALEAEIGRIPACTALGARAKLELALDLPPHATVLVWVTPFDPAPPPAPRWVSARMEGGNAVLRWTPWEDPGFWSWEVLRLGARAPRRVSPLPLRAAMWVDTAPPRGTRGYAVRAISASGLGGGTSEGPPLRP